MSRNGRRIRVLLVEDSALVRKDLTALLSTDPAIEVVGAAIDPYIARDKILKLHPDVLLMDIGLPRMDGLSFLRVIMQHRPMPVIIVSGLAEPGSDMEAQALAAGACGVFHKPEGVMSITGVDRALHEKIRQAAKLHARNNPPPDEPAPARPKPPASRSRSKMGGAFDPRQVLLLGASTGGTEAIGEVMTKLPPGMPGICVVQHIPARFSRSFAERLNLACALEVREAVHGDELHAGLALVAPGEFHMTLHWEKGRYHVELNSEPKVHHQRPAVDVLFDSAVSAAGAHAVAVLLTGMGRDGAAGLKRLRDCGAVTLAQDEASCVVFGMPQAAQQLAAVDRMVSLADMPEAIRESFSRTNVSSAGPEMPILR